MKYLQATITLLSLINPLVSAMIFNEIEHSRSRKERFTDAIQALIAILVVLGIAALVGVRLLDVFGISLQVFRVAGGVVLVWMGFAMLRGTGGTTTPSREAGPDSGHSLAPLVLFAASPGTITGVITLAATHTGTALPTTALVGIVIAVSVTGIALLLTGMADGKQRSGLMHDLNTRFMGLIVLAMGFQFGLVGIKEFFAAS
ncbi:hypothetical protein AUP74_02179 [Microbulbifer aggregans]|uniref:UPF0056 membrane protein n=1 Tax=Microbulbifer aggregans TaxID=1769779 RepID=A0A1C9W904_9GAMM|nr:MarC family protein [Microbulbifer aggregans]AOS97595.1 hypothetical protein AUP74_02179 [Microbulbifer aggregans]